MPSAQDVKVEIIRDLDAVPQAGLDRAHQPHLFDRIEWFRRTWAHCPPEGMPLIARAETGGARATLFLAKHGAVATGLARWYTLQFRPVFIGGGDRPALLAAIGIALRREVSSLSLDHVPADSAQCLTEAFATAGWLGIRTSKVAHWTESVGGRHFATYWADRPGQLRSTVKRKSAKADLDIALIDRFDPAIWAEYEDVYADSWKPEEGSLPFLRDMAETEGAAGCLRIGIARHEGRAVAAQLWTVENGTAIIHKLAYRQSAAALSPGTLLSRAMFERAIDVDRVEVIDYGTGDDRYKADWMTQRGLLEHVDLYNLRSVRGLAGAAKALAGVLAAKFRNR